MESCQLVAHVESITVRKCRRCMVHWPNDWEYCPNCNIWLPGNECTDQIVRIVPPGGVLKNLLLNMNETLVAIEIQNRSALGAPTEIEQASNLFTKAIVAIAENLGRVEWIRNRGIAAYWCDLDRGTESAAAAVSDLITSIVPTKPLDSPAETIKERLSLGIGVILADASSPIESSLRRAFRLASLAHPNRVYFSATAYGQVVERFDFRGIGLVAPRSEYLEPVFELIGRKPERSGTHRAGPDRAPMVGRKELIEELDRCRVEVAHGKSIVVHAVGKPGQGKSRLIREWLSTFHQSPSNRWIKLECHGIPYGEYRLRSWRRLIEPLNKAEYLEGISGVPTVEQVGGVLLAHEYPVLLVIDDLHWVDPESREMIMQLVDKLERVLTIFAYRTSFSGKAPFEKGGVHRRFQLIPLALQELMDLAENIAAESDVVLTPQIRREIVIKSQGNPLYVEEAIAHIRAADSYQLGMLPRSLAELLMFRVRWVADEVLPEITHQRQQIYSPSEASRRELVSRVEQFEEQLTAWLDRFDVVEEEAVHTVCGFLTSLERLDEELGVLSVLIGKQRPHRNRLAQALTRLRGLVPLSGDKQ